MLPDESMEDIFRGVGVEVNLKSQDDFLKVRETLTRIGIASKKEKKLYQSCHILHKRGRYVILSFKELFKLDGKESNFTESDLARRNTIAKLLHDWSLVEIKELEVGTQFEVEIETDAGPQVTIAKVINIENDVVHFDMNHPLAGEVLNFEVEVKDVRDQTPEEEDIRVAHPG